MSPDQLTALFASTHPDDKETARQLCKASLFHTAKYGLKMSDINWRTHGDLISSLEVLGSKDGNGEIIDSAMAVMPRGTFKSSIVSVAYPIWRLTQDPNRRLMIDSATYELSTKLVGEIAQHLEGEIMTRLFGTFKSRGDWSSQSLTIAQRTVVHKDPSVMASGVGATKTGAHVHEMICDDLNIDKNSTTPELRDKVWRHFQMGHAILDPGGFSIIAATRYSSDDIIGRVLTEQIGTDMMPDYLKPYAG